MVVHIPEFLTSLPAFGLYTISGLIAYRYYKDKTQKQHSILRTHPILGWIRYGAEQTGEELRQYWFYNSKENRPMDRDTQTTIAKMGKEMSIIGGFGSRRDFSESGFYLRNAMFAINNDELEVNNNDKVKTFVYQVTNDGLFLRHEKRVPKLTENWLLKKPIVIGSTSKNPFEVYAQVNVSGMSYGSLSASAVKALAQGTAIAGGGFMNTGEGGVSKYHKSIMYFINDENMNNVVPSAHSEYLPIYNFIKEKIVVSNFDLIEKFGENSIIIADKLIELNFLTKRTPDLIYQIGSGMNGAQKDGKFHPEIFQKTASSPFVKAIEIKLAQGAKTKGGHMEAKKVTPEIAEARGIEPYKAVSSPNRFSTFNDVPSLVDFIEQLKQLSEKPVGIKVVIGDETSLIELASYMAKTGKGPDFITVDGGEGGTGAAPQTMADSVGLPIYSAITIVDDTLKKFGLRDRVVVIASGMLATADKVAIALGMGADLINVARAAMNTIGCINAMKCHTNQCPVGVTSHDPKLEKGLVVEEKRFRTANYLITMRKELFSLAAACGLKNTTLFTRDHVVYKNANSTVVTLSKLKPEVK